MASYLVGAPTGDATPELMTRLLTPIKFHEIACNESQQQDWGRFIGIARDNVVEKREKILLLCAVARY
ncbi:uncharacterized protein FFB20_13044 [Fusarium fujikuroi]|uniref:Uncharacterized protein n=1 Tax=Fusarium fujikuroi TaxID=5127 RepID=A0A2H3RBV8_FUSFU|nr:uncharacterized protein Y057_8884 [Fusarium fujikuroi]SCN73945.1 uncharacterized protein FFC1_01919 [Fusarium fujikuroi]SCO08428.1 uncharacterized protein FFB20_13044 [Fusarium fujikuroi]VTT62489.1 unnamed protein product [Fusarium fujikuroi]